jgi:membrane protease YdiL (CAAX protease family)
VTGPAGDGRPPDRDGPGRVRSSFEWPDERAGDPARPEAPRSTVAPGPQDVPGGRVFSLEGRRAPGLYLVAWILSVTGLVVTFLLGPMASDPDWGTLFILLGAGIVTVGLAAGAGSQILERAGRDPERYRGPAPLLVFGVYFFAMSLVGLVLVSGLDVDSRLPFNFLAIGIVQAAGYLLVVWLFAVRSGALTWPQMGWPTWHGPAWAGVARSVGVAVVVMLPTTMVMLIVGGIVGTLLGTDAPQVLPGTETVLDGAFVALAAAIVIPVGEEVFFRGFAQTAWTRDLGPRSGLLRATVLFAVVHIANIDAPTFGQGLAQVILTLVVILPVGYVLGWLFARHGLVASMAGHISYNSLLLLLAFVASSVPEPAGL